VHARYLVRARGPQATKALPPASVRLVAAHATAEPPYDALLLVSFGGPETSEEVAPFLERVTRGRGIPPARLQAVAEHYYAAGGASPVNGCCRELLASLERETYELGLPWYWGNRNWHPLLERAIAQMRDSGVRRALAFVTSAYGGYSSCRQYREDIEAARSAVGRGAPEVDKIRLFYNHPGWVGPWADSVSAAIELCRTAPGSGSVEPAVLFSAHSIPVEMADSSPYAAHVNETARLVALASGTRRWQVVWQSRSGNPSAPWLGPDVCEAIEQLGPADVVVAPIGFVCENMEVVHDLDVEAAAAATKVGARMVRARTVSTSPAFVTMVGDLVRERFDVKRSRGALGPAGPWPDACPVGHCPPPPRAAPSSPPPPPGP